MHPSFEALEREANRTGQGDRLRSLLLEISRIVGKDLDDLRFDDKLKDLCPIGKWTSVSVEFDDLQDLVLRETQGPDVPADLSTVGNLLTWVLDSSVHSRKDRQARITFRRIAVLFLKPLRILVIALLGIIAWFFAQGTFTECKARFGDIRAMHQLARACSKNRDPSVRAKSLYWEGMAAAQGDYGSKKSYLHFLKSIRCSDTASIRAAAQSVLQDQRITKSDSQWVTQCQKKPCR